MHFFFTTIKNKLIGKQTTATGIFLVYNDAVFGTLFGISSRF